jgi:hypothetical protein
MWNIHKLDKFNKTNILKLIFLIELGIRLLQFLQSNADPNVSKNS